MFGLFDQFNTDDPTKQARLAQSLALLEAGGPSRVPVSLFQGLGMAGKAGLEAKRQAQKDAQAKLLQDMQLQQFTSQQDELKRKREREAGIQSAFANSMQSPQGAVGAVDGTLPPELSAGILPNAAIKGGVDPEKLFNLLLPHDPKLAVDMRKTFTPERAKIKEYSQIRMPDGSVKIVGLDEYGQVVQTNQTPFVKPEVRDFGGTIGGIDPISGQVTRYGDKTQSPDSIASNQVTMRGQNMTDARAREATAAGRVQYDPERGGMVNLTTGQFTPVTQNGTPIPARTSESTKKELASIDAQMSVLDGALRDVAATPKAFSFKRGLATMTGPLSESVAGRFDSSGERDARSYVFNVVSKVINERAGAAQSAQELARLRSFLPAETDNAEQITDKLNSFKGYLADLGNGYQPGRYKPQAPKPAKPSDVRKEADNILRGG